MSATSGDSTAVGVPLRALGRSNEKVSMVGLGGYHAGKLRTEQATVRLIREAVDAGITFLDNSWDYHDGESETRMGAALTEGYRDKVFLMTKIDGRTRASVNKQLHESLKRLRTECIDLVQFHEVIRFEDADRIFSEGGIEALMEARAAGKVRYIGFTGHKDPAIHLYMLEVSAAHGFTFDAVQMPLNVMDAHFRSFERKVLPELVARGIAPLGMKSMAAGKILQSKAVTPIECLHYAMNLPTSVVITGIEKSEQVQQAVEAARTFTPLSPDAVARLLARTTDAARHGRFETFKTTSEHDETTRHLEWLG